MRFCMSSLMSTRCLVPALLLLAGIASSAANAGTLKGKYTSPLGPLDVKEAADGTVTGSITTPKNACNFPVGTKVLSGTRLDDSCVAGTFTACKVITDTCAGIIKGDTILLVAQNGGLLSGTIHLDGKGCKTPLTSDALVLKKAAAGAPKPPAPPKPAKVVPADVDALLLQAQTLINNGEAEEARKKCTEASVLDPTRSQAYGCIGVTYYQRERYDEAFEYYAKAIEADPTNPDTYYNMGCVYAITGKAEEAIQYIRLAVLNGYIDLKTLSDDADLKSLHGNPAFEKLKAGELE
jgi:hypothetical protein